MFRALRRFSALQWAAAALIAGCASGADGQQPALPPVIPAVAEVKTAEGTFRVAAGTRLQISADPGVAAVARYFVDLVARTRGLPLELLAASTASQRAGIVFRLDPGLSASNPESYELAISPAGVTLSAREPRGLFYGAVTLWQLLTSDGARAGPASLRSMVIRDEPRFVWRGFMLDVARHYMPPELVKQMIDWMALHKLNTLHWHLTDDQGWRLEILKYPKLTDIGAWRTPAGAAGAGGKYGGYYTQDQVRAIVRYAADRFITIVPEFDMPGHAQAAIAAYPRLGTEGAPPPVSADWGVHTYLFNVEEDTFTLLEDVLAEMIELFPGEYVHVGGDEAVKDRWIASASVQQRMRELGIADETTLQGYFVGRIEQFLRSKGRRLIGWDEILEGGLPPAATVMSWRGPEGAIEAARAGHEVIMATMPTLYLDYLQSDSRDEPPGRPTYVTLEDVYGFEPVPAGLSDAEEARILGAQLNAWTEHMRTPERIEHNAFPRLAALAEVLWSPRSERNWPGFVDRLPAQFARYEALGIGYADSAFEARFTVLQKSNADPIRVQLSNQVERGEIRYTLDASEPDASSSLYREPLVLDLPARVRAATFLAGRRVSAARTRAFDSAALATQTDDELEMCTRKLVLRLEDDAPPAGERAVFNIDIMDPCWIFKDADLSGVSRIAAAVGQLPFNFQIGDDARRVPLRARESTHGELEVRLDRCDGERIAVLPLAPAAARDDVTALDPVAIGQHAGRHDLCLSFTRDALEPMWAIDRVQLLE